MSPNKRAYFQGGGGDNEPTPGKKKYKDKPIDQNQTKARGIFFPNYDLYDTGDPSPGTGLYQHMNEYDSVADFRKKKKKENRAKRRKAMFEAIMMTTASAAPTALDTKKKNKDNNNLTDLTEETTPIPWNPNEVSQLGLLDGIYPKEDLDDAPVTNLYYGRSEMHPVEAQKK